MSTAAVILAAGAARRFGSPKQLAELDGRSLLTHVVAAAASVAAITDIVVVLGANADAITAAVDLAPARAVRCAGWQEGLSASLRAGVAALPAHVETALILLGDQPRITAPVIALVVDRAQQGDAGAVRASYRGAPGHPVALGRTLLAQVPGLRGDAGARDLLAGAAVRLVEAGHLCDPTDVDTPADLRLLASSPR